MSVVEQLRVGADMAIHQVAEHRFAADDILVLSLCLCWGVYYLRGLLTKSGAPHALWYERPQKDQAFTRTIKETNVATLLEKSGKDLVILWGSQSGTSERLAWRMSQEISKTFSKKALVIDLSDIEVGTITRLPRNKPVLFLLSTYGEGDPSDNATSFCEWLSSLSKEMSLESLPFAVLGFGNSTYKHYNRVAHIVQSALEDHGAEPFLPLGLADDAAGLTEEHFWSWVVKVFEVLKAQFGFFEQPHAYEPALEISFGDNSVDGADMYAREFSKRASNFRTRSSLSAIRRAKVRKAANLTPDSARTCLHLEVDIAEHAELKYDNGDHIGIWPENPEDEVEALRRALGIEVESMYRSLSITQKMDEMDEIDMSPVYLKPTTLHALFSCHLGIRNLMSRKAVLDLEQFAPSQEAKQNIRSIGLDREAYSNHKKSYKMTMSSVLLWASSGKAWDIPLSFVLETLPMMEPRYYSIASSPVSSPRQISLTISLLSIPLGNDQLLHGVTSGYLRDKHESAAAQMSSEEIPTNVLCHIRKSKFKPPISPSQPMLMVATGSGVAPFRGFLQQRTRLHKMGKDVGKMILFFGCRDLSEELYRDELLGFQRELGGSLDVVVAYSRASGTPKCHVQDKIREQKGDVAGLIVDKNAKTYLCGSTDMAREVKAAIGHVLCEANGWSSEKLADFLSMSSRTGQWQEDVWG